MDPIRSAPLATAPLPRPDRRRHPSPGRVHRDQLHCDRRCGPAGDDRGNRQVTAAPGRDHRCGAGLGHRRRGHGHAGRGRGELQPVPDHRPAHSRPGPGGHHCGTRELAPVHRRAGGRRCWRGGLVRGARHCASCSADSKKPGEPPSMTAPRRGGCQRLHSNELVPEIDHYPRCACRSCYDADSSAVRTCARKSACSASLVTFRRWKALSSRTST
jgi:hypothetical protein